MKNQVTINLATAFAVLFCGMMTNAEAQKGIKNTQLEFKAIAIAPYDTMVEITCVLTLEDTTDTAKIHFKLGKTEGGKEMLEKDFSVDKKNNLPKEMSYRRKGNKVYLTLGKYYYDDFYYEADVVDKTGKKSAIKKFRNTSAGE